MKLYRNENKIRFVRKLVSLLLLAAILSACFSCAAAETGREKKHIVTVDMELKRNLIFARYDVTVEVDGEKIDSIAHGGRMIKILELTSGIHTFTVSAKKDKVEDMSFDIYVSEDMAMNCTLQTHRKFINVNSLTLKLSNRTITFDESEDSWADFLIQLVQLGIMSEM